MSEFWPAQLNWAEWPLGHQNHQRHRSLKKKWASDGALKKKKRMVHEHAEKNPGDGNNYHEGGNQLLGRRGVYGAGKPGRKSEQETYPGWHGSGVGGIGGSL